MDKLLFKRILIAALSVLAVVYVCYLLLSANFNVYPTENAVETTITDKIYTDAFILRDEAYITNTTNGVLSYTVDNGDEVNEGGVVAKVYSSEKDAAAQTKADKLDQKKEDLEALQSASISNGVGIDTINNDITNELNSFLYNKNAGEITSISKNTDQLMYSINQRQVFTGKITNFSDEIKQLTNQINDLRNSSGQSTGNLKSKRAGYFSGNCDGYESSFSYKNLDKMKLSDLKSIKKSSIPDNVSGKIISSLNWYVACEVSPEEATKLSLWDSGVNVMFSDATSESVPGTIYKIVQKDKDSNALLLVQCNYMNSDLSDARQEPVEIGLGSYKGLRVSKKAIHEDYVEKTSYDKNGKASTSKKKVQGVYVLYGSEVQFKQISIIYSGSDYVICDESPQDGILFNGDTVSLYDKVIVGGENLYDGKIIE